MKLINSSFEILEQKPGLEGIYEAIEKAGRVCYKSERPEGKTAKDFVDMLIKRGHLSPLEHGTVYLFYPTNYSRSDYDRPFKYSKNPYSKVNTRDYPFLLDLNGYYITTNYRVLIENDWLDDLKYLCEPTEYHEKRVGVRVNCSIGISREWNRHRTFSICEQSTRYCNYSKDRFDNELTFIIPSWINKEHLLNTDVRKLTDEERLFIHSCNTAEDSYLYAIKEYNMTPQQAREVLPLSTATEVVYTGYASDWSHFFQMRCDNAAHPDMKALAIPLKEEFIKRGYIE